MFFGAKKKSVGATVLEAMPVWDADAIPLQSVKVPKPIEPQVDPVS
jgi:hypothetical protein